jgi:hypothetical protein
MFSQVGTFYGGAVVAAKNQAGALRRHARSVGLAAVGAASPMLAQAAAVDTAALVTDIGLQATPIGAVGMAVLMILFGVVVYKWIRRAF